MTITKNDKEPKPAITEPKDIEAARKARLEAAKKAADEANKAAAPDMIKAAKAAAKAKEEQIKAARRPRLDEKGVEITPFAATAQPAGHNDYTGVRQFVRVGGDTWHPTQIKWILTTEATGYGTRVSSTTP